MTCLNRSRYVWPNITGVLGSTASFNDPAAGVLTSTEGAFSWSKDGRSATGGNTNPNTKKFVFNANDSNALYSGSTNQPAAGLTLLCIKI